MPHRDIPERLSRRIAVNLDLIFEGTPCWEWTGRLNRNGYGYTWWAGKDRVAHRVVYQLLVCEVPKDRLLDHLCRNRKCCNPLHIEPVSHSVNTRRGNAVLFGSDGGL